MKCLTKWKENVKGIEFATGEKRTKRILVKKIALLQSKTVLTGSTPPPLSTPLPLIPPPLPVALK